ncbi:MAG: alpha/beta hydrolase [Gammaproteobacteria bacterium]|nr:alpha/beta hydrolase [Gammaproteobacteria bacterium]
MKQQKAPRTRENWAVLSRLEPESLQLLERLKARDELLAQCDAPAHKRRVFQEFPIDTDPPFEGVAAVNDIEIPASAGAVKSRLYHPHAAGEAHCLAWFHGGGHVVGDLETHDALCRVIANQSGCAVLNVDYRLAPEHPFPAAFEDAVPAIRWLGAAPSEYRLHTQSVSVGGSSAGGNLATAAALEILGSGGPDLLCQLLVYPPVDATLSNETYSTLGEGFSFTTEKRRWSRDQYVGDYPDLKDPRLSPAFSDSLSRLPRTLVVTAELDPLRGEAEDYARRLEKAGVDVTLRRYPGVMHGFFSQSGYLSTGKAAVTELAATLRKAASSCLETA